MLTKLEGVPEGEEEPPHRWSVVLNVITGYALKSSGLWPEKRDFVVHAQEEDSVRAMLGRQYPTIDFTDAPMEIYPLESPDPPKDLEYHPYYKSGVMEIPDGHKFI